MRRLSSLLCLLVLSACATTPPPATFSPAEAPLVDAMARRLEISREVAWIKYRDGLPIRDPRREAAVLDTVSATAAKQGLDADRTRAFFAAQIAASCAEQERLTYLWKRGAPLPTYAPRSLRGEVRQDIDAVNRALLDALARLANEPAQKNFSARAEQALIRDGFSRPAARLASAPLQPAPH